MKNNYVFYDKLSKKAKREHDNSNRRNWNGIKPYTRIVRSRKRLSKADRSKMNASLRRFF